MFFSFFETKNSTLVLFFEHKKTLTSKNQPTKQNEANTKQQRQYYLSPKKLLRG